MTLDNDNGTDGQTDGQTDRRTDRQSATHYAAPPREEGRIKNRNTKRAHRFATAGRAGMGTFDSNKKLS